MCICGSEVDISINYVSVLMDSKGHQERTLKDINSQHIFCEFES